jgi:hypothetical protein
MSHRRVVEIVSAFSGSVLLASGVPVEARRAVAEIDATNIIIVPSVLLGAEGWQTGRYPKLVAWAERMHDPRRAAVLGMLRRLSVGGDWPFRWSADHGPLGLC